MANCKYSLTLKGKTKVYNSYNELFSVLMNNRHRIELGDITDLTFSLNPQSEIVAKIENIKAKNKSIDFEQVGIDSTTEDMLYKSSDNYIHISELLANPENKLNNPFNLDDYKTYRLKELKDSGKSEVDATEELEKELNKFQEVAIKSQQVKSVVAMYFSGMENPRQIMEKIEGEYAFGWDYNLYASIVKQLQVIKDLIKDKHGDDVKIIANVPITSSLKNSELKLYSKIDIVAIDRNGVPHIYLFKSSEKSFDEWQSVKEQDIDYKLGFDRHMLASNGFGVKDTELYVVPINLILDNDNNIKEVNINNVQNRLTPSKSGLNRLTWGSGSFYANIDKFVPVTITDDLVVSDIRQKVLDNMLAALGTKSLQNTRATSSLNSFISRVKESDNYSKGKWMFLDTTGTKYKTIYIKETSPKESNTELREKASEYLERESKKYEKAADQLIKNIKKALKGKMDFGEILPDSNRPSYLSQMFSKYMGDDWDIIDIPKLRDLGIFGMVNNKTKQIDFFSISYHFGLNNRFDKFGLGTTLLGKFESDKTALAKSNILYASNGNIELMKILFAINEMPELFNGVFKVGSVRAINPIESSAAIASQPELWTTFNELCNHLKIENNLANSIEFADPFDILAQDYLSALTELKNIKSFKEIGASLITPPQDVENKLKIINRIIKTIDANYKRIVSNILDYKESPIANLYVNAWTTKFYLEGDPFYQSSVLKKFNIVSGVKMTAPSLIGDKNLKTMNTWIQNTLGKITAQYNKFLDEFQYNYIRNGLWKDKGYSQESENIWGSQNKLYDNMIVKDPTTGKVNSNLIVKNPWTDPSLSREEKRVLKKMLFEWNKWRYPVEMSAINSSEDPKLQKILEHKETSFWIPIVRASTASRLSQRGFVGTAKQLYKDIKDFESYFRRNEENLDTDNEEVKQVVHRIRNNREELFKFFNPIEFSEHDISKRADYIASQDLDYWSRNLEEVTLSFELINLQKREYNILLPKIKALKIVSMLYGEETGTAMDNFVGYLEDQTKISIHNQTILNEEAQKAAGIVSLSKYLTSSVILGFNIRGIFREHIEGAWKLLIEGLASKYGNNAFTMKDVKEAEAYIYGDAMKQMTEVTKAEKLNQMFRLANLDLNALAQRTKTNKGGLLNYSDRWLFWCNTAPDFRKRLVMLIAQLKHDGIWDALSIENDSLKYEWKKDKRFNVLAKEDKSNPEYGKQLGLYLQIMNDINAEDNTHLKFGDELPRMYTRAEMNALKNYSDRIWGSFDHETKIQAERTFVGMLIGQFKTYLTATKAIWLTKPGLYNLGKRQQALDDQTGQKLWLKEDVNNYGESVYTPTTKNTGIPLYINVDSYYAGIMYSFRDLYRAFKEGGLKAAKTSLLSDKLVRANMVHASMSIFITLLIIGINKYLFDLIKSKWNEERAGRSPNYGDAALVGAGDFFAKAFTGSVGDLDLIGTVYNTLSNSEIAVTNTFAKFIDTTQRTIFGDMKVSNYLKANIGVARATSTFWENMVKVYKYNHGIFE